MPNANYKQFCRNVNWRQPFSEPFPLGRQKQAVVLQSVFDFIVTFCKKVVKNQTLLLSMKRRPSLIQKIEFYSFSSFQKKLNFLKWDIFTNFFFFYLFNIFDSILVMFKMSPVTGFELWTSGIRFFQTITLKKSCSLHRNSNSDRQSRRQVR